MHYPLNFPKHPDKVLDELYQYFNTAYTFNDQDMSVYENSTGVKKHVNERNKGVQLRCGKVQKLVPMKWIEMFVLKPHKTPPDFFMTPYVAHNGEWMTKREYSKLILCDPEMRKRVAKKHARPVIVVEGPSHQGVVFNTPKAASDALNIDSSSVYKQLTNKLTQTKKYKFKYVNEEDANKRKIQNEIAARRKKNLRKRRKNYQKDTMMRTKVVIKRNVKNAKKEQQLLNNNNPNTTPNTNQQSNYV